MRRRKQSGPVDVTPDGMFVLNLADDERQSFNHFLDELESLLNEETDDGRLRRLFPTAYHNDALHDAEYQRLMRSELLQSRRTAIDISRRVLDSHDALSEGDLMQFMQTINSLRLVLGTMLDVSENDEAHEIIKEDDPNAPQIHLYAYLGWLLECVVDALQNSLD